MQFGMRSLIVPVLLGFWLSLLQGCSHAQQRVKVTAPEAISDFYSETDIQLQLVTEKSVASRCFEDDCDRTKAFDLQVKLLSEHLSSLAYLRYPELRGRIKTFRFEVVEKVLPMTASNAKGRILLFRGVQAMRLDDAALAFVLAREMGHVIARHHDENSATRLMFAFAAAVMFPALNLFGGTAALAEVGTASGNTALFNSAASSATSYFGTKVVMARVKPEQLQESDTIALLLLQDMGWSLAEIEQAVTSYLSPATVSGWVLDYQTSEHRVMQMQSWDQALQDACEWISPLPDMVPAIVEYSERQYPEDQSDDASPNALPEDHQMLTPTNTIPITPQAPENMQEETP